MLTFEEYLTQTAAKGEGVNLVFEKRLFELVEVLHKVADALTSQDVLHEVIGGLAVLIHVEEADPSQSMLTRDVDLMIRREDLERVIAIVQDHGFRFRHTAGLDMLLYGENVTARNAVHLLFAGEKVKPNQVTPNPPIAPERKQILGKPVWVIRVADLLRMKLSAYRDKDRVHTRIMDAAGLITPAVQAELPSELQTRLQHIRETE